MKNRFVYKTLILFAGFFLASLQELSAAEIATTALVTHNALTIGTTSVGIGTGTTSIAVVAPTVAVVSGETTAVVGLSTAVKVGFLAKLGILGVVATNPFAWGTVVAITAGYGAYKTYTWFTKETPRVPYKIHVFEKLSETIQPLETKKQQENAPTVIITPQECAPIYEEHAPHEPQPSPMNNNEKTTLPSQEQLNQGIKAHNNRIQNLKDAFRKK
jgi:hypothetical protein